MIELGGTKVLESDERGRQWETGGGLGGAG